MIFLLSSQGNGILSMAQKTEYRTYDLTDKFSIWEYSKNLLGKTLEEAVGHKMDEDNFGKGRLGQMVER